MARSTTYLPTAAWVSFRYNEIGEMPWAEIESAASKTFSEEERQEILKCAQRFDWDYFLIAQAPSKGDVLEARKKLLKSCDQVLKLADRFPPVAPSRNDSTKAAVAFALQIYFGTQQFHFRETYARLVAAAGEMKEGLSAEASVEFNFKNHDPEIVALSAFLQAVIKDADSKEARSTPASRFQETGFEYERWGIAVGPRATGFAQFVSSVLDREISPSRLRTAWPDVREIPQRAE